MSSAVGKTRGWSLRRRVLFSGGVVVALFVVLTAIAAERAFRDSLEQLGRDRLLARVYLLMSSVSIDAAGDVSMPVTLPEPRLAVPGSGSYASISSVDGKALWSSDSSVGLEIPYAASGNPGRAQLQEAAPGAGGRLQTLSYPVYWELDSGDERIFIFQVAESRGVLEAEVGAFRWTLWRWLGGGALMLLVLQAGVLIWSLRPVRRVAEEVRDIEAGTRDSLGSGYPRELTGLTDGLNALIAGREARLRRYRNTLSDLAHSLKTPLAVLRATQENRQPAEPGAIDEQLERMQQSIDYHVQRAAMTGHSPLAKPIRVATEAQRVIDSLKKIYHEKALHFDLEITDDVVFAGDPGDLAELLGNLGDNACKWARSRVRISARNEPGPDDRPRLHLSLEDDGPGIPEDLREAVLKRGVRADTQHSGQGIGLAVVRETVEEIYGGSVQISDSELGGTRVSLAA